MGTFKYGRDVSAAKEKNCDATLQAGIAPNNGTEMSALRPAVAARRLWRYDGSVSNAAMTSKIEVVKVDITTLAVDAIVNAANTSLLGGGGVDGAIHRAAGPELFDECYQIGGCPTGEARLTKGYRLPAKFVIHTVGPVWGGGERGEPELLANCYRSVFSIARENGIRSLAFPAISCGVYRFPVDRAVKIAVTETVAELVSSDAVQKVIFACFGDEIYNAYRREVDKHS
jgi:O-acetyl-ADP-ribose deacetylase (regulator of RNase III)